MPGQIHERPPATDLAASCGTRRAAAFKALEVAGVSLLALAVCAAPAAAAGYTVHPLVTDDQAVLATLPYGPAPTVDPALINPWDFANASVGPWVVANAGGPGAGAPGTATVYNGAGMSRMTTITIPQGSSPPYGPTGVVFVGGAGFRLPGGGAATYVFDDLDESISGWNPYLTSAVTLVPGRDGGNLAAYTGLEVATLNGADYLYAANNITGAIDVFDVNYKKVSLPGGFVDPKPNPKHLLPFNIQNLAGHMWVTYAVPGPPASAQTIGSGFVSEFNLDGTFLRRFTYGGRLSSPWGIAIAPANFGHFSNDVLIGNFNDGSANGFINAYDPTTGAYLGLLQQNGRKIVLPGLWALQFGNGGNGGKTNHLYFTAGIGQENHGLFGEISAAP